MVLPDWVSFDSFSESMCDKQSNLKIVDLEYLNENNILVTTLWATMRNYRLHGGLCEGCPYEYKRYFLNPGRHDCVARVCVLVYARTHTQTTWVLDVSPGVRRTPGEPEESRSTEAQYTCRQYRCKQYICLYICCAAGFDDLG